MIRINQIPKPRSPDDRNCEECGSPLHACVHHKVYTRNEINPSWPATVHDECGVIQDPTLASHGEKKYSPYSALLVRVLRLADKKGFDAYSREMLINEVRRLKALNLPDRTIIARTFQRIDHRIQRENFMKFRGDPHAEE